MSRFKQRAAKRLNWLILLMTLSLLGVTGIQAYWLKNAYDLREEKFESEVGQALADVTERLDNLSSMRFLFNSFSVQPFFSENLAPHLGFPGRDTMMGDLKLTMRLGPDTVILYNTDPDDSLFQAIEDRKGLILRTAPDQMMRKGAQLDMLLRKMVRFELSRRQSDSSWMDRKMLDSLITFELKSRGIDIPYEFAVANDKEIILSSRRWDPNDHQHTAMLFPNDILTNEILSLSFPSKANYIFQSLWVMLLVSLLFTVAIVYTFYRTLNFSLKQKRISDIKTDFINNMTHEFKTPIATINLAIDALRNPKVRGDSQRIEHYSNMIKQENQRMNLQVESVLRMALLDKQELDLEFKKADVIEVVQGCLDHISLQLESKGGRLQKFFNEQHRELRIDANHLSNTIINILDNAMKYSVGAPEIKVVTESTQNHFILIISDKGMGMTKEEQKHIFDRFYRVSAGDLHNIKGHGLGLSYAKGIVESHGGRIEVESEKGKGSKFYIYLPINA
ncbi:sensor histidine kinase [Croceimicrobium hydrocarbonivorans]|uniref:histidine kinase n=1 Tax=Croceimicrobium hydrocarbonivorans TaxID=2761580 RepID=A0A7H0VCP6_9FLAO|nr:HAMP domain-containing sensor histidine kinase [Croceimicrobium hydrocarbonivorans]QNR23494.1 HAMP domain-containing histidine kinase [Croceimicrobium hydrocarbonivorans]